MWLTLFLKKNATEVTIVATSSAGTILKAFVLPPSSSVILTIEAIILPDHVMLSSEHQQENRETLANDPRPVLQLYSDVVSLNSILHMPGGLE